MYLPRLGELIRRQLATRQACVPFLPCISSGALGLNDGSNPGDGGNSNDNNNAGSGYGNGSGNDNGSGNNGNDKSTSTSTSASNKAAPTTTSAKAAAAAAAAATTTTEAATQKGTTAAVVANGQATTQQNRNTQTQAAGDVAGTTVSGEQEGGQTATAATSEAGATTTAASNASDDGDSVVPAAKSSTTRSAAAPAINASNYVGDGTATAVYPTTAGSPTAAAEATSQTTQTSAPAAGTDPSSMPSPSVGSSTVSSGTPPAGDMPPAPQAPTPSGSPVSGASRTSASGTLALGGAGSSSGNATPAPNHTAAIVAGVIASLFFILAVALLFKFRRSLAVRCLLPPFTGHGLDSAQALYPPVAMSETVLISAEDGMKRDGGPNDGRQSTSPTPQHDAIMTAITAPNLHRALIPATKTTAPPAPMSSITTRSLRPPSLNPMSNPTTRILIPSPPSSRPPSLTAPGSASGSDTPSTFRTRTSTSDSPVSTAPAVPDSHYARPAPSRRASASSLASSGVLSPSLMQWPMPPRSGAERLAPLSSSRHLPRRSSDGSLLDFERRGRTVVHISDSSTTTTTRQQVRFVGAVGD